jgi:hypothetical protein
MCFIDNLGFVIISNFGQLNKYGSWPFNKEYFLKIQLSISIGSYLRTDADSDFLN